MKHLLLVETDATVSQALRSTCERIARATICHDFLAARSQLLSAAPDILVTNLRLGAGSRIVCALVRVAGQSAPATAEWPSYGGDLAHTRYSPAAQIDASNFNSPELAWRFKTDSLGPRPEYQFESTPLMVNGRLY